jgi:NAD(P)-dependent dehydrogenase (short-subunit alcohol dehydrogenase family)
MTQYCATKVYDDQLSRSITESYQKRNINTLIVQPGIVTTGMTHNAQVAGSSCQPEECVRGSLSQLGLLNYTYGATIHTFFALQCHAEIRPVEHAFKLWFGAKYDDFFTMFKDFGMLK